MVGGRWTCGNGNATSVVSRENVSRNGMLRGMDGELRARGGLSVLTSCLGWVYPSLAVTGWYEGAPSVLDDAGGPPALLGKGCARICCGRSVNKRLRAPGANHSGSP